MILTQIHPKSGNSAPFLRLLFAEIDLESTREETAFGGDAIANVVIRRTTELEEMEKEEEAISPDI